MVIDLKVCIIFSILHNCMGMVLWKPCLVVTVESISDATAKFFWPVSLLCICSWRVKEMSGTGILSKHWRRAIFYPVRSAKRYEVQLTLTTHNDDAHHQTKLTTTTFHLNNNARINKRHHATWRNRDRSQYNTQSHPPLCSTSHRRRHCSCSHRLCESILLIALCFVFISCRKEIRDLSFATTEAAITKN